MSQFKTISKKAPWYFISNILVGLSGFILLPIYTKYLTPEQYGGFQALRSVAEFLPLIISFSLHGAFSRLYFDHHTQSPEKVKSMFSTLYWFLLIWGFIIYFTSLFVTKLFIVKITDLPYWPLIPMAFLAPVFNQISLLGDSLIKIQLNSRLLSILSTVSFFSSSAVNVILLMTTDLKIESCLLAYILINFIPFCYFTYLGIKTKFIQNSFDWKILKETLHFSVPMQIGNWGSWIIGYSDRIILSYFSPLAVVGNYAVSVTISKVLYMFNDAISQIHGPLALDDLSKHQENAVVNLIDFIDKFMALLTLAFLGMCLFSPEIIHLFLPESYQKTVLLLPLLSANFVISGLYRPFVTLLSHFKKNWETTFAMIAMTISGLILNLSFIPIWGDRAAAISKVASVIVYTTILIFYSNKNVSLKINYARLLIPFVLSFIIAEYYIHETLSTANFISKVLIFILFTLYYALKYKKLILQYFNQDQIR